MSAPDLTHAEGHEPPPPGVRAMAVVRWTLVLAMAALAVGAVGWRAGWFGHAPAAPSAHTLYTCPMHPGVRSEHPGECPICGMTLVPLARLEHDGGAPAAPQPVPGLVAVTLTPERQQLMGMRTATVTRETLAPRLRTVGTIVADEQRLAVVQTRASGWIEELRVSQTGQKVAQGQVLATFYSPEILQAEQELLTALRWSASGPAPDPGLHGASLPGLGVDARTRLELLGVAPADIEAMVRSGQPVRAVPIRAPRSGHVIDKPVVQGMAVQPGASLFQIADLSRVWVLADVYEYEVARVKVGQEAGLELAAYPGERFTGKVTFVYPTLDPATRTLRVRLELPNRDLRLKPGMYGNVELETEAAPALVVPTEAVVDTGLAQYVFVALPGGRFEPRPVQLGARAAGKIAVLSGVSEGETVVTTANFLLDSESRLRATVESAPAAPGAGK